MALYCSSGFLPSRRSSQADCRPFAECITPLGTPLEALSPEPQRPRFRARKSVGALPNLSSNRTSPLVSPLFKSLYPSPLRTGMARQPDSPSVSTSSGRSGWPSTSLHSSFSTASTASIHSGNSMTSGGAAERLYNFVSTRVRGRAPCPRDPSFASSEASSVLSYPSPPSLDFQTDAQLGPSSQKWNFLPNLSRSGLPLRTLADDPGTNTQADPHCPTSPEPLPNLPRRDSTGSRLKSLLRRRKAKTSSTDEPFEPLGVQTSLAQQLLQPQADGDPATTSSPTLSITSAARAGVCMSARVPALPRWTHERRRSDGNAGRWADPAPACGSADFTKEPSTPIVFGGSIVFAKNALPKTLNSRTSSLAGRRMATLAPTAEDAEAEGDETEIQEMMTRLRNIGPPGKAITCNAPSPGLFPACVQPHVADSIAELAEDSDASSDLSFDVEAPEEAGVSFMLPSWPSLSATSRSPFLRESLAGHQYRPMDCSVSVALNGLPASYPPPPSPRSGIRMPPKMRTL